MKEDKKAAREEILSFGWTILGLNRVSNYVRPKRKQVALLSFFQHLHKLLTQGLSISEALSVLCGLESSSLKLIIECIQQDLQRGFSFSKAISKHPAWFSDFIVQSCVLSERMGKLADGCQTVILFLQTQKRFQDSFFKVLFYPCCLFAFLFCMLCGILWTMVPSVKDFFYNGDSLRISVSQKVLFCLSDQFRNHPGLFIGGCCVLFNLLFCFYRYCIGSSFLFVKAQWIFWMQSLSRFLDVSIPLKEALKTVRLAFFCARRKGQRQNKIFRRNKRVLSSLESLLLQGLPFSVALKKNRVPLLSLSSFVRVGESSGCLGDALYQCAQFEQNSLIERLEKILAIVSPLLVLLAGGVILWIVFALFIPLYENFVRTI